MLVEILVSKYFMYNLMFNNYFVTLKSKFQIIEVKVKKTLQLTDNMTLSFFFIMIQVDS